MNNAVYHRQGNLNFIDACKNNRLVIGSEDSRILPHYFLIWANNPGYSNRNSPSHNVDGFEICSTWVETPTGARTTSLGTKYFLFCSSFFFCYQLTMVVYEKINTDPEGDTKKKIKTRTEAGNFSILLYWWPNEIFSKGSKRPLCPLFKLQQCNNKIRYSRGKG